jgi:FAD/FMN-containing dehydrogenase
VGAGLSYGDSCLNEGGTLLDTTRLDRFIEFDRETGRVRCEPGVTLSQLIALALPAGWFPAVVPGTAEVTIGGAVANDVHGKNHHVAGTFGDHVKSLELARSDGSRRTCSRGENTDFFAATVGGLGLTGLITSVELELRRVKGPMIAAESTGFASIEDFVELSDETGKRYEYSAAWIDAAAPKARMGRGVFLRGGHDEADTTPRSIPRKPLAVPMEMPGLLMNALSMRAFNALYRARDRDRRWRKLRQPCWKFLFPLDAVGRWNRLYGARGFLQHQGVVPREGGVRAIRAMLDAIADAAEPSPLAVVKVFGEDREPAGILSFPRPGITTAFDFPIRGASTFELLDRLDRIVVEAGGAIYPAKDARMSPAVFEAGFPQWRRLEALRDPAFSSSFWRRVTGSR